MLVSLGLDHRRARLEIRERFHLDDDAVPRVRDHLCDIGADELVLARTCNRIEAYCWWREADSAEGPATVARAIARAWMGEGAAADALLGHATLRTGADVTRHLLRVAGGLESQILGDIHILGQLRRSFRESIEARTAGPHLHRLFETALRVGKRIQRETPLMSARRGVGSETARLAVARLGPLAGRACLVVGCGKSGAHSARSLVEQGATDVRVLNRTVDRAENLAREIGAARAGGLDALAGLLLESDLVVVATGAPEPVLTRTLVEGPATGPARSGRPLLVIDISVPRNVEASVGGLAGVELVDLDALHPEAAQQETSRRAAVPQAEALVEEGVQELWGWMELHAARRALVPLRQVISEVCRRELIHLAGDSPQADRTVDRIVARVMAHPMTALRAAAKRGEPVEAVADTVRNLFDGNELSSQPRRFAPSAG